MAIKGTRIEKVDGEAADEVLFDDLSCHISEDARRLASILYFQAARTVFSTGPKMPRTRCLFSSTQVNTTAVLAANATLSIHSLSASYCLGSMVATARGATNKASSFRRLADSSRTLQPHKTQPVPTQMPLSILCRDKVELPRRCGPRRVRARQTP